MTAMFQPVDEPQTTAQVVQPQPHRDGGLSQADMLTVYGPLGIGWAITLAAVMFLWRDQRAQRREFLADQERRDKERKVERDEFRETMLLMAKEGAAASIKNGELWREHGRELRGTLESASRKIGSRE